MAKPRYKIEIITESESLYGPGGRQNKDSSKTYINIWKDGTWYLQNPSAEQLADFLSTEFGFEVEEISDTHVEVRHSPGHYVRPIPNGSTR